MTAKKKAKELSTAINTLGRTRKIETGVRGKNVYNINRQVPRSIHLRTPAK